MKWNFSFFLFYIYNKTYNKHSLHNPINPHQISSWIYIYSTTSTAFSLKIQAKYHPLARKLHGIYIFKGAFYVCIYIRYSHEQFLHHHQLEVSYILRISEHKINMEDSDLHVRTLSLMRTTINIWFLQFFFLGKRDVVGAGIWFLQLMTQLICEKLESPPTQPSFSNSGHLPAPSPGNQDYN